MPNSDYMGIAPPQQALQPGSRRADIPTQMLGGAAASQMAPDEWMPPLPQHMAAAPYGYGSQMGGIPSMPSPGMSKAGFYGLLQQYPAMGWQSAGMQPMDAPVVAATPFDPQSPQLLGPAHQVGRFNPQVPVPGQMGLLDPGYMAPSFSTGQYAAPYGLLGG